MFTNNSNEKPSDTLVEMVQTAVDPNVSKGDGMGFAPIGHSVTVSGVTEVSVDFDIRVALESDYVIDDVRESVKNVLEDYLKSLRKEWAGNNNITVYKFVSGSEVLKVGGIKNIESILLNNSASDVTLDKNSIPIRGNVSVTA